jgi:SHS2 domain-containing protein
VGFELIEHTADVGILARGDSPEEVFEQACFGLLEIMGAWAPGEGERIDIELTATDLGALLVEWLNEIIFLRTSKDIVVTSLSVDSVTGGRLRGWLRVAPSSGDLEGTDVKAATFHQLRVVEEEEESWCGRVFLDV